MPEETAEIIPNYWQLPDVAADIIPSGWHAEGAGTVDALPDAAAGFIPFDSHAEEADTEDTLPDAVPDAQPPIAPATPTNYSSVHGEEADFSVPTEVPSAGDNDRD